jgi:hypothetical protein
MLTVTGTYITGTGYQVYILGTTVTDRDPKPIKNGIACPLIAEEQSSALKRIWIRTGPDQQACLGKVKDPTIDE